METTAKGEKPGDENVKLLFLSFSPFIAQVYCQVLISPHDLSNVQDLVF